MDHPFQQDAAPSPTDTVGKYAALLTASEVGLGSLLHGWRVPMSGSFLSLNQGFLLCKATRACGEPGAALRVSMVGAVLKSLSPAGKRLTPMLAISVQGLLFSGGTVLFGAGALGTCVGMVLLSLWSFLQPALLYLLIFGEDILFVGAYFLRELQKVAPVTERHLLLVLAAFVLLKALLAAAIALLAVGRSARRYEAYLEGALARFRLPERQEARLVPWSRRLALVGRDLLRPWFLCSLGLMAVFFLVNRPEGVQLTWVLLRPLSAAIIVFYLLRFAPVERWLLRLASPGSQLGLAMSKALDLVRART